MMRYLFNGRILTAIILATGAIEILTNAPAPTLAAKVAREVPSATASRQQLPVYIAQTSPANSVDAIEKAVYNQVNQYRASKGLPPLTANTPMSEMFWVER